MEWTLGIFALVGWLGWGITLYVYSRKFKTFVDTNVNKVKDKAQEAADKDNQK